MAVAIRGTTPASTITVSNPVSLTLTGSQQPQSGDVLLIVHANDFYALSNMPTPTVGGSSTGVTAVTNGSADGGSNGAHAIAYTFNVGSTGDLTVAVTETGSADEEKALVVYVLSGVDTGTPVDVAGNATNTGATTHICPSVSPTSSDAYLICHTNPGGGAAPASYTHPSGMTETLDTVSGGLALGGAILQLSVSGATGSKTFTPSNSVTASANLSIAVKTGGAAAAPESSAYAPVRLAGRIGPDRRVFLPNRFDDVSAAVPLDVTADVATLILSGVDPTVAGSGAASVTADVATLVLSGIDATFGGTGTASIPADTATLTFSGIDSTIAGSGATSVTADVATLTFSGVDVSASSGATNVTADVAVLTLIGVTSTIAGSGAASTTADVAVLTFSGVDVTATSGTAVAADTAVLTLSGVTPTIAGTGAGGTTADAATLALTGITPALAGSGVITATVDTAVLVFVGVEVGGFVGQQVTPDDRIHLIPAVSRTYEITALPRMLDVMADPRTLTVPVD